ncbi:hypothetical protein EVAR_91297_1 [Eumeta japonica]|uniref:Reverse transcriptase/retrotransposon-derived protein RNase H-like domain-containing protein n=1 Tax=Eumeta variegata TaxID=151549 RepID=A0A4C1TDG5_EUMVA|nr:hypothetical protein EVAR_91297_1 [Eumeta japonica]
MGQAGSFTEALTTTGGQTNFAPPIRANRAFCSKLPELWQPFIHARLKKLQTHEGTNDTQAKASSKCRGILKVRVMEIRVLGRKQKDSEMEEPTKLVHKAVVHATSKREQDKMTRTVKAKEDLGATRCWWMNKIEKPPSARTKGIMSLTGCLWLNRSTSHLPNGDEHNPDRKFVPGMAKCRTNNEAVEKYKIFWTQDCQQALEQLKKALQTPLLIYPDFTQPFRVTTDATTRLGSRIVTNQERQRPPDCLRQSNPQ